MPVNERRKRTVGAVDERSGVPDVYPSRFDRFFAQLDHQRVGVGSRSWIVNVYGVHIRSSQAWLQLAPSHDPTESVVLTISDRCTASQALAALDAWTRQPPEDRPHLIKVMQIA